MGRAIALAVLLAALAALGMSFRDDGCGSDSECAERFGGNGDPEPMTKR